MHCPRRGAADPLLHRNAHHSGKHLLRLCYRGAVSGEEDHRNSVVAGDRAGKSRLPQLRAIEGDRFDGARIGVVGHRVRRRCPGVKSDEGHGRIGRVDSVDHSERPRTTRDQNRPPIEPIGAQIGLAAMRIDDVDFARSRAERSLDGGVGLRLHQCATETIIPSGASPLRAVHQTRDALHVHGNVDFLRLEQRGSAGEQAGDQHHPSDPHKWYAPLVAARSGNPCHLISSCREWSEMDGTGGRSTAG